MTSKAISCPSPTGGRVGDGGRRLLSLDILRGITVAAMIFVNNGYGDSYEMFQHSEWNGMTPCDLVFPFFLFIMGVSCYLSLSKFNFEATSDVIRKVVKRTFLLFFIGVFIHWFENATKGDIMCFDHLRIWAVLQRIALCYCAVSLFAVLCNHKYIIHTIIALLVGYAAILILGHGYENDAETNILAIVDRSLFGAEHLYTKRPIDPEGLVGTIACIAHTLLGFYCGKRLKQAQSLDEKIIAFLYVGAVLVFFGYLLSFGMPLNKRIWSPSYALMTCGLASLLQGILMYIIDKNGQKRWCTFFHVFGVNALAIYISSEFMAIIFSRLHINDLMYNALSLIIANPPQITSTMYALSFVLLNFAIGYPLWKKKIYIKL